MVPVKRVVVQMLVIALGALLLGDALGDENEFPGKALFKRMVGEWTSEGELISTGTGDVITVSEVWVGKFIDGGKGFVIEGDRVWNGENQTFKWVYSYNATTELLGVVYTSSDLDKELVMEVSVNEAEGSILRQAPMGDEGAEIQIENKFVKEALLSRITLTGSDGQTTLEGSMKHSRKKTNE